MYDLTEALAPNQTLNRRKALAEKRHNKNARRGNHDRAKLVRTKSLRPCLQLHTILLLTDFSTLDFPPSISLLLGGQFDLFHRTPLVGID